MSFKKFSSGEAASTKEKPEDKPQEAAAADQPAAPPVAVPAEVTPAPKS
jgi:hypothetical protein